MKILKNVKVLNVTDDPVTQICTIELSEDSFSSFIAKSIVHYEIVDDYFDDNLADSYTILVDGEEIVGITPSGSKFEREWEEYNTI